MGDDTNTVGPTASTMWSFVSWTQDIELHCTCEHWVVHRQVHQCEYGSNFTRSCTTPGVRAPSNACTVGRSAPLQLLEPPQSDTRATTGTTCGCELETKETTQTGIITVIRRMEAKVKRNCDNVCVWGGISEWSSNSQLPGYDAGRFRVKVNGRDSARTQGNTLPRFAITKLSLDQFKTSLTNWEEPCIGSIGQPK